MSQPTVNVATTPRRSIWIVAILVSAVVAILAVGAAANAVWELSRWTPRGLTIPAEITGRCIVRCAAGVVFLFIPILLVVLKGRFLAIRWPYQVLGILVIPAAFGVIMAVVPAPIADAPNVIRIGMAENGRLFTDFNHDRHHYDVTDGRTFCHSSYKMTLHGSVSAPPDEDWLSVTIDVENRGDYGFALFFENLHQVTVTSAGRELEMTSPRLPPGKYRVVARGDHP